MENSVLLKNITHERRTKERICDWEYVEVTYNGIRVYYKSDDEIGLGFLFYAVERTAHIPNPKRKDDEWQPDYAYVECVYFGTAYFDGIRHLYMGDIETDNFGYHYYADLESHIETLKVIHELEKKYCRDWE